MPMPCAQSVLLLALASALLGCPASAAQQSTAAAAYLERLLEAISDQERRVPAVTGAAEEAAQRLLAGGRIWLTGSHQGFISEGLGRAGGMMTIKALGKPEDLGPQDVVLLGAVGAATPGDEAVLRAADERGAFVVLFTPRWPGNCSTKRSRWSDIAEPALELCAS